MKKEKSHKRVFRALSTMINLEKKTKSVRRR